MADPSRTSSAVGAGPAVEARSTAGAGDAAGPTVIRDDELLALLIAWLPDRRWFPAKGTEVSVELVDRHLLTVPDTSAPPGPVVLVQVVRVWPKDKTSVPVVLQVPLVVEPHGTVPTSGPGRAGLIGTTTAGQVFDGPHHPAFVMAWLREARWADHSPEVTEPYDLSGLHVLTGEQSNTSVILPGVAGGGMLKILRALAPGPNPDIVVPLALAADGWAGVPAPYAWTELTVHERGGRRQVGHEPLGDGPAGDDTEPPSWTAHSGVLAELVPEARDGFELACDMARDAMPFTHHARELGTQVAQMHSALRRAFVADVHDADPDWLLRAMQRRVASAATASATVRSRLPQIDGFLARMRDLADEAAAQGRSLPPVQRIHGDLHLGQALYSPRTGWRILDFEGEPLRPLVERTRPDLGERDVAGMLRSFDYAAAVGGATSSEWVRSARRAFLDGYTGYLTVQGALGFGRPPTLADRVAIQDAFELDKALYEIVYEEGNRPDWISIPLSAVDRILGSQRSVA